MTIQVEIDSVSDSEAIRNAEKYLTGFGTISSISARPSANIRAALEIHPGHMFSVIISKLTGLGPCPKSCRERIQQMNQWGWWKCWSNRQTIAGWLVEEGRKRGHTVTSGSAIDLLRAAFKELRLRKNNQPANLRAGDRE
jgi:hypothetical protein